MVNKEIEIGREKGSLRTALKIAFVFILKAIVDNIEIKMQWKHKIELDDDSEE